MISLLCTVDWSLLDPSVTVTHPSKKFWADHVYLNFMFYYTLVLILIRDQVFLLSLQKKNNNKIFSCCIFNVMFSCVWLEGKSEVTIEIHVCQSTELRCDVTLNPDRFRSLYFIPLNPTINVERIWSVLRWSIVKSMFL